MNEQSTSDRKYTKPEATGAESILWVDRSDECSAQH